MRSLASLSLLALLLAPWSSASAQICDQDAIDCGDGTCCPAPAEACGEGETCILPCEGGLVRCGETFCAEPDSVCCADVGHPELTCSSSHICTEDGGCRLLGAPPGCGECNAASADARPDASAALVLALILVAFIGIHSRGRATQR